MNDKKFLQKEIEKKDFIHKGAVRAMRFWVVVHTDEGGYVESDINVHVWENDDFTISDNCGDGFVSLHGDIAQAVIEFLS